MQSGHELVMLNAGLLTMMNDEWEMEKEPGEMEDRSSRLYTRLQCRRHPERRMKQSHCSRASSFALDKGVCQELCECLLSMWRIRRPGCAETRSKAGVPWSRLPVNDDTPIRRVAT